MTDAQTKRGSKLEIDARPPRAKRESEFGTGLVYPIGLYLAHAGRIREMREAEKKSKEFADANKLPKVTGELWPQMWFNGASDHLFDIQYPKNMPPRLMNRIDRWSGKARNFGHGDGLMGRISISWKDVEDSIDEGKAILRAIDRWLDVKSLRGRWE